VHAPAGTRSTKLQACWHTAILYLLHVHALFSMHLFVHALLFMLLCTEPHKPNTARVHAKGVPA